jgi:hypothetical protein
VYSTPGSGVAFMTCDVEPTLILKALGRERAEGFSAAACKTSVSAQAPQVPDPGDMKA